MKKLVAALVLAFLMFGAVSVSWGKGKASSESATWEGGSGESATWEKKSGGKVWE